MEEYNLQAGQSSFDSEPPVGPIVLAIAGAVVGLAVGWVFFSSGGARLRARLEPVFDTWSQELRAFRATLEKAQAAVHESRESWERVRHFAR